MNGSISQNAYCTVWSVQTICHHKLLPCLYRLNMLVTALPLTSPLTAVFCSRKWYWLQIQRAHAIKLSNRWCKTQSMSSAIFLCGDSPRSSPMDQSRVRSPGFYVIRTFGYTVYVRKRVFQFLLETWFSASSDDLVLLPLAGRGAWTLILYHCDRAWVGSRLCYLWLATLVKVRTDSYHVRAVSVQKVWRECSGLLA